MITKTSSSSLFGTQINNINQIVVVLMLSFMFMAMCFFAKANADTCVQDESCTPGSKCTTNPGSPNNTPGVCGTFSISSVTGQDCGCPLELVVDPFCDIAQCPTPVNLCCDSLQHDCSTSPATAAAPTTAEAPTTAAPIPTTAAPTPNNYKCPPQSGPSPHPTVGSTVRIQCDNGKFIQCDANGKAKCSAAGATAGTRFVLGQASDCYWTFAVADGGSGSYLTSDDGKGICKKPSALAFDNFSAFWLQPRGSSYVVIDYNTLPMKSTGALFAVSFHDCGRTDKAGKEYKYALVPAA